MYAVQNADFVSLEYILKTKKVEVKNINNDDQLNILKQAANAATLELLLLSMALTLMFRIMMAILF